MLAVAPDITEWRRLQDVPNAYLPFLRRAVAEEQEATAVSDLACQVSAAIIARAGDLVEPPVLAPDGGPEIPAMDFSLTGVDEFLVVPFPDHNLDLDAAEIAPPQVILDHSFHFCAPASTFCRYFTCNLLPKTKWSCRRGRRG